MQETLYVRSMYATGDPARIDAALDGVVREAPGLLSENAGYRRFGLFADRDLGKIVMSSWWETADARTQSDARLRERRMELLRPFADTVTTDQWEAPSYTAMPDVPDGAFMRMGRTEFDPADADVYVRTFQDFGRAKLEAIDGLVAAALFIDRAAGRAAVGTLHRDEAALASSRAAQSAVRGEALRKARVTLRSIEEFEVVMLHRRPS